jgi:RimJ/RimL family protein N-acetyltransferase
MESYAPDIYPTARIDHFETDRLLVRRMQDDDRDSLIPIFEDPAWARGFGYESAPDPQASISSWTLRWNQPLQINWAFTIIEKASRHTVGYTIAEIRARNGNGWQVMFDIAISSDFRCRGYAYEAARGLIDWIFDGLTCPPNVRLDEIRAECLQSNDGSLGLLRKLSAIGMRDYGEQQGTINVLQGKPQPGVVHVFSITREDYRLSTKSDRQT